MIPRIFIGSSNEGKEVAITIQKHLNGVAECVIWDKSFDFNTSAYDSLASQIPFYDYAILVATADDTTVVRNKGFETPRDNVVFEFGLFAGGLGREKVFYVVEQGVKVLSDLSGITLPFLPKRTDVSFDDVLEKIAGQISKYIKARENTFHLGFLPSTAMAYGYFTNFVAKAVKELFQCQKEGKIIQLDGDGEVIVKEFSFTILIPTDLTEDMEDKVVARRLRSSWKKTKLRAQGARDFDFSVDVQQARNGNIYLVDIPMTLGALAKAIDLYTGKNHIGKDFKEKTIEHREIRSFMRTLQYLIDTNSFTRDFVKVELVEI